jgi:hypothetical protein
MTLRVHRPALSPRLMIAVALAAVVALLGLIADPAAAQEPGRGHGSESRNMRLLGHDPLQARSAYQPLIKQSATTGRWIAYVGHHGGRALNPLTGEIETNGTSLVDVTNPRRPRYLSHIPGPDGGGGAQMVRVCDGRDLPQGDPERVYMLRTHGNVAHQIWDVSDARAPTLLTTVVDDLRGTHKNWWECETGIAYLVSGVEGWRSTRMTQVFDLGDPAAPRFIRNFGLPASSPERRRSELRHRCTGRSRSATRSSSATGRTPAASCRSSTATSC